MSDWKTCTLGEAPLEIIDGDRGKNYPKEFSCRGYCLFLSAKNVTKTGFVFDEVQFIDKQCDLMLRKGKLNRGDIVLTTRGTVGNLALYDASVPFQNIRINSGMVILRVDGRYLDNYFLYYVLKSAAIQNRIENIRTGSAQPQFPISHMTKLEIPLPDIQTQRAIATVLRSLDNKITNNTKINHHLEQLCFAIYRHFFVEGAMPEWKIGTIADLGEVVGGSTPSKSKPEYYTEHGIAWITPKDLSVNKNKFIAYGADDITELGLRNSSTRLMPRGTVLFSSRAPIGYIAIASGKVSTNQGFKSIIPKEDVGTAYVYFFLKDNLQTIEGMASGSTFKEVSGTTMKGIPAVIPGVYTLACFKEVCAPMFEQQELFEQESAHLADLRDTLLPRLMSGDLSVADLGDAK